MSMKKQLNEELIQAIKGMRGHPLISVIGAISPSREYVKEMGFETGFALREFIEKRRGSIFTGGVDGVGVDIYAGILAYCLRNGSQQSQDDRFFVLVPQFVIPNRREDLDKSFEYAPPQSYEALAMLNSNQQLGIEVAGVDMSERRRYLAEVADVFVALNGGLGTVDEATMALQHGKSVVALANSGGAAGILAAIKTSQLDVKIENELRRYHVPLDELMQPHLKDNIKLAYSPKDIIDHLSQLY